MNTLNSKQSNMKSKKIHTINMIVSPHKCSLKLTMMVVRLSLPLGGPLEPWIVFILTFWLRRTRQSAQIHQSQDLISGQERPYQRCASICMTYVWAGPDTSSVGRIPVLDLLLLLTFCPAYDHQSSNRYILSNSLDMILKHKRRLIIRWWNK